MYKVTALLHNALQCDLSCQVQFCSSCIAPSFAWRIQPPLKTAWFSRIDLTKWLLSSGETKEKNIDQTGLWKQALEHTKYARKIKKHKKITLWYFFWRSEKKFLITRGKKKNCQEDDLFYCIFLFSLFCFLNFFSCFIFLYFLGKNEHKLAQLWFRYWFAWSTSRKTNKNKIKVYKETAQSHNKLAFCTLNRISAFPAPKVCAALFRICANASMRWGIHWLTNILRD